jgi:C-terminal processing protease CtpA/Prc
VVTQIFEEAGDAAAQLQVGDVIVSVDGEDIAQRRNRMAPLIAASTPQALHYSINHSLLMGPKNSIAVIKAKNSKGEMTEVSLKRTIGYNTRQSKSLRSRPVFHVLDEGFGYIDLQRLTRAQVAEAFECVRSAPAIIFDMRGYPQLTAWTIGARLVEEKTRVALFSRPEIHGDSFTQISTREFYQHISPGSDWKYKGKIVVLINEGAGSQAEHSCLILEACGDATFIGTPTIGVNGDVTATVLPGGIVTGFTGHRVRYADGRQLQRLGVQPHITVAPTIAGIKSGKDELLDAAVEYLQKHFKSESK